MRGETDPRLIGLLQGVMGLADALRDAGTSGDVAVRLGRDDGLLILKLVAGANDADAEAWSQCARPPRPGFNSLSIASLTFEWPQAVARQFPVASRLFAATPEAVSAAANENNRHAAGAIRFYGFEEETPALR